ncbi:MAG TPA: disulfide bond formation protein B [Stellaceae bacterium]|nr:disulfide bond formation protein B [Stellaceae bacterium]
MNRQAQALTPRVFSGFVLAVSGGILGAALLSQYWGGLVPCELCLVERWPWVAAIAISLLALFVAGRPALPWVALTLSLVFAAGAALGAYHVGVEQHWLAGPAACTASPTGAMTLEQMKAQIMGTAPVMCDKVQWAPGGISLAGWNLIASLIMAILCIAAFVSARRAILARRGTAR